MVEDDDKDSFCTKPPTLFVMEEVTIHKMEVLSISIPFIVACLHPELQDHMRHTYELSSNLRVNLYGMADSGIEPSSSTFVDVSTDCSPIFFFSFLLSYLPL